MTALSGMEAELIDLAHSFHDIFPVVDMSKYLGGLIGITIGNTNMNVSIHEYNYDVLVLENNRPPQYTPRINYYAYKTIWF